jgi:putative endonuclease
MKVFYVYILASKQNGTLYVGVTNNIVRRVYEHKNKLWSNFTAKYNVTQLVYYEEWDTALNAIGREKQIKNWKRSWKLREIERENPEWKDLYDQVCGAMI